MTTENDDLDSSWDSLADELGVDATKVPAEPVQPPAAHTHHKTPAKQAPKPKPEPEPESFEEDDFGGGLEEAPKDEEFAKDEEFSEDADGLDGSDGADGEEGSGEETAEGTSEEGEGKKKRRRRRRRRKKGGANPEAAATPSDVVDGDSGEFEAVAGSSEVEEEETVEEGEAPVEMSDDDEESENLSAVDEEMNTASTGPRQEWKVMSWNELVGKLHRPN